MNTLSMSKKPREVGLATKKKKKCLYFFSLLSEWTLSDVKKMVVDLKQRRYPLPQKSTQGIVIPSFGMGISHVRAPSSLVRELRTG